MGFSGQLQSGDGNLFILCRYDRFPPPPRAPTTQKGLLKCGGNNTDFFPHDESTRQVKIPLNTLLTRIEPPTYYSFVYRLDR
jgi:hypothetical protein